MKYADVSLELPCLIQGNQDTFKLVREIGQGSFASVYLAYDQNGTAWAAKTFKKSKLTGSQMINIRNEARVMALVSNHENIVTYHSSIDTADYYFLIMELCELDLFEAITRQGGFPAEVVKEVFLQIIDAMIHCHSYSVFHRDIKPENILVSSDYRVKITDFGLYTMNRYSSDYGCGSVRYMSPECMNINKTDHLYDTQANDVWSLGILLVNMLFGKNPWHEANLNDPIYSRYMLDDPDILGRQFGLSRDAQSLLDAVFQLDPSERITLKELRARICAIRSFTLSESRAVNIKLHGTRKAFSEQSAKAAGPGQAAPTAAHAVVSKSKAASAQLKIDTNSRLWQKPFQQQQQKQNPDHYTPPDSAFDSGSPMSPVQRVKSRVRQTMSKIFG